MKLYIKEKDGKIIEACSSKIKDGVEIECTEAEYEKIKVQFDAETDGSKITSLTKGDSFNRLQQGILDEIAKLEAIAEPTEEETNELNEKINERDYLASL
jgi:uncharacterized protein with FMN-binding domain